MNRLTQRFIAPLLLAAATLGGAEYYHAAQQAPDTTQHVIVQDVVQASELYQPNHVYKALHTNGAVNRLCNISPANPAEAAQWGNMRGSHNQKLPHSRQVFLDPQNGWEMMVNGVPTKAGKVETEIATRSYDGQNGTSYVMLDDSMAGHLVPPGTYPSKTASVTPQTTQAANPQAMPKAN